jgi:hypothetical protein
LHKPDLFRVLRKKNAKTHVPYAVLRYFTLSLRNVRNVPLDIGNVRNVPLDIAEEQ